MRNVGVTQFPDHVCGWGEGLCWDQEGNRLYFVDCVRNAIGVVELDLSDEMRTIPTPSMPTKILLSDREGVVLVVLDDGIYEVVDDTCSSSPRIPMPTGPSSRFNDATVDSAGRIITGNLGLAPNTDGAYWVWQKQDGWRRLADAKGNANGPCFSRDGRILYFADSPTGNIHHYDYEMATGQASGESVFVNTFGLRGAPDGAAIDSDGYLWTALFGGGMVARYAPDGSLDAEIPLPVRNPTDIVFAGPRPDRLFVTSAMEQSEGNVKTSELAGATFELLGTGVTGIPVNKAAL
jgi:sugar lactone lactonase YvrE